jgi:hypothetical protein
MARVLDVGYTHRSLVALLVVDVVEGLVDGPLLCGRKHRAAEHDDAVLVQRGPELRIRGVIERRLSGIDAVDHHAK